MKHFFRHHKFELLFFIIPWGVYFLFLWSHMLFYQNGNLLVGHPYVWADWSMHIALASNFAFRPISHWFDSLPVFSGAPVTYPFVTNLISGLLWEMGFSLPVSFLIPSIICSVCMLVILYKVSAFLLQSKRKAILAGTLFLCSGGMGFFLILIEKGIPGILDSTQILTQIDAYHIEVNSIIPSMFIPQRAFLLGFPLGLLAIWVLCTEFLFQKKSVSKGVLIATGILVGFLPIIHTHTFLVIGLFSAWLFAGSLNKFVQWLYFGVPSVMIALCMYVVFLQSGVSAQAFFSVHPGWAGAGSVSHWLLFWLKNWGLFLPLALFGTLRLYLDKNIVLLRFVGFFWCLFLIANLVQFQPQQWDNTKLFAWVYFGLSLAVTSTLVWISKIQKKSLARGSIGILIFVLCISGATDLIHNLDFKRKTFQILSQDQIDLGIFARTHTDPEAVFFSRPLVSNPISMIGGRSVYLGYPGWAFSYGLEYSTREEQINQIFEGKEPFISLRSLGVTYIYVEKSEQETDWIGADSHAKKIFENDAGSIYTVL